MTIAALAASLVELLTPAGTIADTISATAPPGWLLLNGQTVVNAQSLYPALWTASPTAWKSGANLVLPNGAARVTVGTDGNHPLGNAGGASGKTITAAHLPQHNHDINHDHGAFTSGPESAHTHGGTTNLGGTHNHGTSAGLPGSDHSPVLYFLGINSAPGAGKPVIGNGGTIQAYADYFDGTSYAPDHTHGFGTSSNSGHSHSIDVPPLGVTNSGGGPGTNAAFDVEQSWIAVNKIIKAH
jgi:microcystin-dependent protein